MRRPGAARPVLGVLAAAAVGGAAVGGLGCAPIPPPRVLAELDQVRVAPAVRDAERDAPPAYAHAEELRQAAHAALASGQYAGAQILGEQAQAAYRGAVASARVVRAERQEAEAQQQADEAEAALAILDADVQRVSADIEALELRLKVLRDAEPIAPSGPAAGAREQARAEAVAALQLQARLLCTAAALLSPVADGEATPSASSEPAAPRAAAAASLSRAKAELAALDELLASGAAAAPIDQAMRVRAGCLAALSAARQRGPAAAAAGGAADELLSRLSELGYGRPLRDDRGVVVTLTAPFVGGALSASAREAAAAWAPLIAAHPTVPIMLVLHHAKPLSAAEAPAARQLGAELGLALGRDGAVVELAGPAQPLLSPAGKHAARNERVEIVFVTPAGL